MSASCHYQNRLNRSKAGLMSFLMKSLYLGAVASFWLSGANASFDAASNTSALTSNGLDHVRFRPDVSSKTNILADARLGGTSHDQQWRLVEKCLESAVIPNEACIYASGGNEQHIIIKDNSPYKPKAYLILPTLNSISIEDSSVFRPLS
jgi:hypothetical protein